MIEKHNEISLVKFTLSVVLAGILTDINSILKILPILYCYYIIFRKIFPSYYQNCKEKWIINLLLGYNLILVIRCIFIDGNEGVLGNWVMSMLGNLQVGIPVLILPFLIALPFLMGDDFIDKFVKLNRYLILVYVVFSILSLCGVNWLCINPILASSVCLSVLYFLNVKRMQIVAVAILILVRDLVVDERAMFLSLLLTMSIAILYSHIKLINKLPIKMFAYVGIGFTIWLLVFNLYYRDDFFSWLIEHYGNNQMVGDNTRSFLFDELISDFDQNHAWIFGKGILGTYFSPEMLRASKAGTIADSMNRLITECGWLLLILKGGLINALLYAATQVYAIRTALKRKERIYKIFVIILLVHFVLMFVSFSIYFDLQNVFYWIITGCCFVSSNSLSNKGKYKI